MENNGLPINEESQEDFFNELNERNQNLFNRDLIPSSEIPEFKAMLKKQKELQDKADLLRTEVDEKTPNINIDAYNHWITIKEKLDQRIENIKKSLENSGESVLTSKEYMLNQMKQKSDFLESKIKSFDIPEEISAIEETMDKLKEQANKLGIIVSGSSNKN